MKCYRAKHIPSGLYFMPSRHIIAKVEGVSCRVKSNLSSTGKVYTGSPPAFAWHEEIYNHLRATIDTSMGYKRLKTCLEKTTPADWLIEEV